MPANSIDSDEYIDGSIDTAHIADNQITLAKMAGIARGKIIYGDASGDPAVLAAGSNTYVLTSDGTDISWGTDSGGATLSGSTNNTITTVTGSNAIQGESSLTYDGTILTVGSGSGEPQLVIDKADANTGTLRWAKGGSNEAYIQYDASEDLVYYTTSGSDHIFYSHGSSLMTLASGSVDIAGALDVNNLTIATAQGSDGQVLTSTGSGVAWEEAGGGITIAEAIIMAG